MDSNKNAEVQYSIQHQEDGLCFKINPVTGTIYLNCQVDREYKDRYDFLVIATDQAEKEPL